MAYLKINKALRAIFFTIGLFGIIYGINDIQSQETGRKGLNSPPENAPFSYYFTVGKS
jgi:hypothetical protein